MNKFEDQNLEETRRIAGQAVSWLQLMKRAPSLADRKAMVAWLLKSPLHVREALLARALDRQLSREDAFAAFDLDAVVAAAREDTNVVALPPRPSMQAAQSRHRQRWLARTRTRVAMAAALLGVALGAGILTIHATPSADYSTAIGEQKKFTLPDGSVVELEPLSEVRVRFSRSQRNIELVAGEASFAVAHDTSRPFRVRAGLNVVQAVGTKFIVNRLPSGTLVSVTEGKVRVSSEMPSPFREGLGSWIASAKQRGSGDMRVDHVAKPRPLQEPSPLSAGETVRVANNGRSLVDTEARRGRINAPPEARLLVFQRDTLADIVQEFNRYNTRQIKLPGGDVDQLRFSGVFRANDAASFLQFLDCCTGLAVADEREFSVVRERTDASEH